MEKPIEFLIAWRHLQSGSPPRWTRSLLLIGGLALVLGGVLVGLDLGGVLGGASVVTSPPDPDAPTQVGILGIIGLGGALAGLAGLGFALLARYLNLLSCLITVSVSVGCTALVVVLSLMGGLGDELQGKILGQEGHMRVAERDAGSFADYEALVEALRALPEIAGASPVLHGEVMVRSDFNRLGIKLVGIEPGLHAETTELDERIEQGAYAALMHPETVPVYRRLVMEPPRPIGSEPAKPVERADPADPAKTRADTKARADEAALEDDSFGADDDDGEWEDPSVEIPKLRAEGTLAPKQPVEPAAPGPEGSPADEDGWGDEDGWEDPSVEIPRLREAGELPPALPPMPWAEGDEPPASPAPAPAPASPDADPASRKTSKAAPPLDPLIIGRELAAELGVRIGMRVQLITPVARITPAGAMPGVMAARVGAEFHTRQYEYDSRYAYASLERVQALVRAPGRISHIELRLTDPDALDAGAAAVRAVIAEHGRDELIVEDWRSIHRNLFSAMFIEKAAIAIALLFVILVAAFGILATSLMAVLERASEIAILKAMGISDARIARVFVLEGLIVGVMGSIGGILTGLAVCAVGSRVGVPMDEDIFYIQQIPLEVDPLEVALVGLSAILIVWLSSVYPARAAARMRPVDALRLSD